MGDWAILSVPIYTLARYKGMGDAPVALRKAGAGRILGSTEELGSVALRPLKHDTVEGAVKNLAHFKDANSLVYKAAKTVTSERILVIGGECSETVGVMGGLSEAFQGKAGMLWLDAHGDFNTPETSPSGYIGGMCLAMACGRTPALGLEPGSKGSPLADERLVHVGSRALDPAEVAAFNSSPAKLYTAQQVKKSGAADVAEEAARHLDNRSDWIACHLDVDVVDPAFISAVNYPTPGGLGLDEAVTMVRELMRTGKLKALEVAAYNPSVDRNGASATQIVALLKKIFATGA
jgi:arginase